MLVAAAAAICAVLAVALLPVVPAGAAVGLGFVPSLAGGWFVLRRVPRTGGRALAPSAAGVALFFAHATGVVPVGAAILLAR